MKKLLNCISVVALLVLTACGGATVITPMSEAVDFTIEGGENRVDVKADGSWKVKECPEWVKTEIQDSVLVITTARNETGAVRTGSIVLSGKGEAQAQIKVTQAAKCTHITPGIDNVEFDKEGGTQTVNIDTDGALQVEAPEGFTASYASGVLTINAAANDGQARSGEIRLADGDQSATIAVSQKGNVCPKCNGSGTVKCSKCGGKGYTVKRESGDSGWYDEIYYFNSYYGCKKCGGSGFKTDNGYPNEHLVKGSGRMTCPDCGGSGK